jgi:serine/threonine-protein kinase
MGEVYRARDEKLGREVALKVLPAEMAGDASRLERFQREARAVAALNHPNIVTLYSVEEADGTHFLTMELLEGRTLGEVMAGERMALGRFFEIASPLASAMAAAHGRGITHRDLKPANVMLTDEGFVKVLDFGLAKLAEGAGADDLTQMPTEALTQDGMVVGTIPYMSPEQVEGKPLDHRTDIFSLGVLFYEMVTGSRPFEGETQPALMSAILRDDPPSVVAVRADLPRHLGRVVARCLEKDPKRRYESAASLAYELESLEEEYRAESLAAAPRPADRRPAPPRPAGAGVAPEAPDEVPSPAGRGTGSPMGGSMGSPMRSPTGGPMRSPMASSTRGSTGSSGVAALRERSIAVLPFVNRSGDPDDQYFSDGLSEELINALSKLPGIRVTARSSAFQFRGQELDPREVGEKLGVDAVLEGSVRMAGQRFRITTELVSCADGLQMWSERFDGEMKDIFDTQDEIVQSLVEQFEVELGSADAVPAGKREHENLEAYQLLLRSRHYAADFWEPGLVRGIECLEQAIEIDPGYAQAHGELSFWYLVRSIFGTLSGAEAFPQVRAHALRALEIDPDLGEAHRAWASYLHWHDLDWERADAEFLRALELDPDNVWTHFFYGGLLSTARRQEEIVPPVRRMAALDQLNPVIAGHIGLLLFYAGRVDEAIAEMEKALELFPNYWLLPYTLSFCHWHKRDEDAAIASMTRAIEATDESILFIMCILAAMLFYFGHEQEAERWMARVEELSASLPLSALGPTIVSVVRNDTEGAIEWMEKGRAEHDPLFIWTRAFCEMQGIIQDERIRRAMERLGLP